MIGLLLNPTKADFPPEGLLPHEAAMQPRARIRTGLVASPLVPTSRLRRFLDGWIAAAIAALATRLLTLGFKRLFTRFASPAIERSTYVLLASLSLTLL